MKHREYLVQKGIIKQGARGRLSAEAIIALTQAMMNGEKFSDWNEKGPMKDENEFVQVRTDPNSPLNAPKPTKMVEPVRKENAFRITETDGVTLVVDFCSRGHAVSRCVCRKPKPSDSLITENSTIELFERVC